MPACSCVWITTRVASIKACSDGRAVSQSGNGYEPTTVVLMRGAADIAISLLRRRAPTSIQLVTYSVGAAASPAVELRRMMPSAATMPAAATLPERFDDVDHLEDVMTAPSATLTAELARVPGDLI